MADRADQPHPEHRHEIGPLQQLLGLATIRVTTASSEGKISIEGLDATVARTTVDRLREVTAATAGDAT